MVTAELSLDEIGRILFIAEMEKHKIQIANLSSEVVSEQAIIDDLKKKQYASNVQCETDKRKILMLQAQRVRASADGLQIDPDVLMKVKTSILALLDEAQSVSAKHHAEHTDLTADIGRRCIALSEKRQQIDALNDPNYTPDIVVKASDCIDTRDMNLSQCRQEIQNIWVGIRDLREEIDGKEYDPSYDDAVTLLKMEIFRGKMAITVSELGGISLRPEEKRVIKEVNQLLKDYAQTYLGRIPESIQDNFKWFNGWKDYVIVKEDALAYAQSGSKPMPTGKQTLASVLPKELIAEESNA